MYKNNLVPASFVAHHLSLSVAALSCALLSSVALRAQTAVLGETVYTVSSSPIKDGVVLIKDGKIEAVGTASSVKVPDGYKVLKAKVVTPGLVDAHGTVGLSGVLNQPQDQDQLDKAAAMQPELRAIDAYNAKDVLVEWVRSFGVTTVQTGHAPGALISGSTMVVKTYGRSADEDAIVPAAMITATLGKDATTQEKGKSPGTRAKAIAMLRAELIKAKEYAEKREKSPDDKKPGRDLHLDALVPVLNGTQPLLITVDRYQDILSALRVAKEFNLKIVIDGAAEAALVIDQIKASGFPVIVHPTMARSYEENENLSMETASTLKAAGIPFALQTGFEAYVPKTRVVLWEAAEAAAHGLTFDQALASITLDAAKIIGVSDRLGSLDKGKDADLALYDGDPFEYITHCVGTIIGGQVYADGAH